MGSVMSYALGLGEDRPAPAGILAFSGFVPSSRTGSRRSTGRDTRVFIAHGRADPIMEVGFARRARELLEAGGLDVEYHESDVAHQIDPAHAAAAADWLATTSCVGPSSFRPRDGQDVSLESPDPALGPGCRGRLRLDSIARYLQDVAMDDVDETGWGAPEHLWVMRHIRIEVVDTARRGRPRGADHLVQRHGGGRGRPAHVAHRRPRREDRARQRVDSSGARRATGSNRELRGVRGGRRRTCRLDAARARPLSPPSGEPRPVAPPR